MAQFEYQELQALPEMDNRTGPRKTSTGYRIWELLEATDTGIIELKPSPKYDLRQVYAAVYQFSLRWGKEFPMRVRFSGDNLIIWNYVRHNARDLTKEAEDILSQ